jgi:hypothetical protein
MANWYPMGCEFSEVSIGPNEAISIKTDPADADVSTKTYVQFVRSSIHSVPSEVFTKFPNSRKLLVSGQNIQEIKPDSFVNGGKLEEIDLSQNRLTFLHADTFKGKNFSF